jgi:hypothetical protein
VCNRLGKGFSHPCIASALMEAVEVCYSYGLSHSVVSIYHVNHICFNSWYGDDGRMTDNEARPCFRLDQGLSCFGYLGCSTSSICNLLTGLKI